MHFVRAFNILQQEMLKIFEFVEPSDENLKCYFLQIHSLIIKTCIELEANFRTILRNNGYIKNNEKYCKINNYRELEDSHKLSHYKVHLPQYDGEKNIRQPFKNWKDEGEPKWYNTYHRIKHDRVANFKDANLDNLLDSICGLLVVLSSQFGCKNFDNINPMEDVIGYRNIEIEHRRIAIGRYFLVEFPEPDTWQDNEKYEDFHRSFKENPECIKLFQDRPKLDKNKKTKDQLLSSTRTSLPR